MNLYQEHILEHYHHPVGRGKLSDATHHHCANNPTCGDKICIDLLIKNGVIEEMMFHGEGCAISQASASMLVEHINGKRQDVLEKMTKDDMLKLLGLTLSPNRLKCALLSLETAHKALTS